jgi:hypothetical protein
MAFSGLSILRCFKLIGSLQPLLSHELLRKYSYLPCTIVVLIIPANGLRLSRTRRGGRPHPSDDAVERSLTSREIVTQLPEVSCQFADYPDSVMLRVGADQSALLLCPFGGMQSLLFFNYLFPGSSRMGRILRRNSLRINILQSNSFGWNILRGKIPPLYLLSIFCKVCGKGGVLATRIILGPRW